MRRILLAFVAGLVANALATPLSAQTYPARLIKMIVPAPAGGQTDVLARFLAQRLQAALGQTVLIDNRGGATGIQGGRAAAAAEPDGYTIFFGNTSTLTILPAIFAQRRLRSGEKLRSGSRASPRAT